MIDDDFTFEEDTHTYTEGGVIRPSVTQSLKAASIFNYDHVDPFVLERARARGQAGHKWTRYYDEGGERVELTPEVAAYARGWPLFLKDFNPRFLAIEKAMVRRVGNRKVGGTPDRIALIGKKVWVIDLKFCASVMDGWALQLADYEMMWTGLNRVGLMGRMAVRLLPNSTYSIKIFDDPRDAVIAQAALNLMYQPDDFVSQQLIDTWKFNHRIAA